MKTIGSSHDFCPTGFDEVVIGMFVFYMGRDPSDIPGKLIYPHYSCCQVFYWLFNDSDDPRDLSVMYLKFKSVDSFRKQATLRIKQKLQEAIKELG